MRILIALCVLHLVILSSCKSKPSKNEIKECIAVNHFCKSTVNINSLKIINSSEREFLGTKGYMFIVDYEVEWTSPCQTVMGIIPSGTKKFFSHEEVFIMKMDKGWSCR